MLEVKVTIVAPELSGAINNLAAAIGGKATQSAPVAQQMPTPAPTAPVTPQMPAPAPTAPVTPQMPAPAPQMPTPMAAPTPVTNAPTNYPAPNVPLAPPPQYTVDQIMAAGATLMDAGKVNELMNLLHSFGVQAVMDLKPEQLGAFATAMRELGAKI